MQDKLIYYRNLKFVRDDNTGYYLNSTHRLRLHRYVWECERGVIPKDYEIHHIDFDRSNNDVSNLMCMHKSEHRKLHASLLTPEQREFKRQNIKLTAVPKAIEWHKSEEGHLWHLQHGNPTTFTNRSKLICDYCGIEYLGTLNSKFCSNRCKSAWRRKSGIDNIQRVCPVCGNEFATNKYKPSETCSKSCALRLRHSK